MMSGRLMGVRVCIPKVNSELSRASFFLFSYEDTYALRLILNIAINRSYLLS